MTVNKRKLNINIIKKIPKKIDCSIIDVPMYNCKVLVVLGKNSAKLAKLWDNESYIESAGTTINYINNGREIVVIFPANNPIPEVVAHEFLHCVQIILKDIGHKNEAEDGVCEPAAYLLTYLIREFGELVKKNRSKKKK